MRASGPLPINAFWARALWSSIIVMPRCGSFASRVFVFVRGASVVHLMSGKLFSICSKFAYERTPWRAAQKKSNVFEAGEEILQYSLLALKERYDTRRTSTEAQVNGHFYKFIAAASKPF